MNSVFLTFNQSDCLHKKLTNKPARKTVSDWFKKIVTQNSEFTFGLAKSTCEFKVTLAL